MKIYRLPQLAESAADGSYLLGQQELKAGSVSLAYCRLRPGEPARKAGHAAGSDEIICVLKGSIMVTAGKTVFSAGPGEAFHLQEPEEFIIENNGQMEAVYLAAGGSSGAAQATEAKELEPAEEPAREDEAEEEPEFIITRDNSPEQET